MSQDRADAPTITVIITTFRRPHLLPKALQSCIHQKGIDDADYEIVVVDNCPDKSAHAIVLQLAAKGSRGPEIRYVHEPNPGISNARNAGLRAARGRFIAFLDDDQEATPALLSEYLQAWSKTKAAALFGPVEAVPEGASTPAESHLLDYHSRRYHVPDLADITKLFAPLGTNNAFFDRQLCFPSADAFDVALGTIGGEDTLLFRRLIDHGLRFRWAERAVAREFVSRQRLTHRYMCWRRFRSGQIRVVTCLRLRPPRRVEAALWMIVGVVQVVAYGALAAGLYVLRRSRWRQVLGRAWGGAGKVLWMSRFLFPAYGAEARLDS